MPVFRLSLLVALALIGIEPRIVAQTPQGSNAATYQDWVVLCERHDQGSACEMTQTTRTKDSNQLVSAVAVGAPNGSGPATVVFQVAVNVWVQGGISLVSRDGQTVIATKFRSCLPSGCFAQTDIGQNVVQKLRAMKGAGSLRFEDANQKPVGIAVSFEGFGQAYDAMTKRNAAVR
jgi:invasion protein IalB